jgi:predicted nucleic acid-binding protein
LPLDLSPASWAPFGRKPVNFISIVVSWAARPSKATMLVFKQHGLNVASSVESLICSGSILHDNLGKDTMACADDELALIKPRARYKTGIRSDWLPRLQELAAQLRSRLPELAPFLEECLQLRLVIDANYIHRELQWRLRSRRDPSARSALHESADSRVLVLFAPDWLHAEIEEHLDDIARRSGTTVEAARAEWTAFRPLIHFYRPTSFQPPRGTPVVDLDDLAYVAACRELAAHAIYSMDKHFQQMEAPVITVAIDSALRTYARGNSIRFAVMIGSAVTVTVSIKAIQAAVALIGTAFRAFQKLHPLLQVAIIGGLAIAYVNPQVRARLMKVWQAIGRVARPVLESVMTLAQELEVSSVNIDAAQRDIRAALPPVPKRSALAHARRICLVHGKPISLPDLAARMKAEGYTTKARDFTGYLKRVLRYSGEFVETPTEHWILRQTRAAALA